MRKKSLLVLATAAVMVFGGAMTAHAEETQWYTELSEAGFPMDFAKENMAQADAWAERHKGDIASIASIEERYAAVVNEVVNFLEYDTTYTYPMLYYTIRDQKGVCSDYTLLTGALCEKVGIEHEYVGGTLYSVDHPILKVNTNGEWRYSDPTGVESGAVGLYSAANGWLEDNQEMHKRFAAIACGNDGDGDIILSQQKMTDRVLVKDRYGNEAMVLVSDAKDLADGKLSLADYLNKYGLKQ